MAPYGWKDITIIYIVTELYKRKLRDFTYRNQPRFPLNDFVNKALVTSERQLIETDTRTVEAAEEKFTGFCL